MTAYDDYNASGYTRPEIVPTDWQRLAVLQTEREVVRRQMDRDGTSRASNSPNAERYWALDKQIREGIGK